MEARKQAAARAALVGTQGFHIDDDPFEGLSPEEIQEYVQQQTGASDDDPFEVSKISELQRIENYVHPMPVGAQCVNQILTMLVASQGMSPEEINAWVEEHGGPPKGL